MRPHEKAIATHQDRMNRVYQRLRWFTPRGWSCLTPLVKYSPERVRAVLLAITFVMCATWVGLELKDKAEPYPIGWTLSWIGAGLAGCIPAFFFAPCVRSLIHRFSTEPALGHKVERMILSIKKDERLVEIMEGWLEKNGGSVLTKKQCCALYSAREELNRLEAQEADRLQGLALLEAAFGSVNRARAKGLSQALEEKWEAPTVAAPPKKARL